MFYKILFLAIIATTCVFRTWASSLKTMEETLPAYALALRASLINSSICHKELEIFKTGVDERKLWALRMLDSSGEAKPGFVYGNNYWFGVRSQCQDTTNRNPLLLIQPELRNNSKYRNSEEEFPPFGVNYFVAHFRHNSTLQYHVRLPNENLVSLGLCLPVSCSTNDLGIILQSLFRERILLIGNLYSADFKLLEVRDLKDDYSFMLNGSLILVAILTILTFLMMIVGTIYDLTIYQKQIRARKISSCNNNNDYRYNDKRSVDTTESAVALPEFKQSTLTKFILCFSCYTNSKIIFDTKLGSEAIPMIHGIRFLGMIWIIMIHTVFYMADYADNKPLSWRLSEGFLMQTISNSTLSVDTYFFLSGFLISYLYLNGKKNKKEDNKSINYKAKLNEFFLTVLRRFIRLTPAYMMIIGLAQIHSSWFANTSQYYMSERPQEMCAKYWWRNFLYINNLFFDRETMCLSWSWYLSNDMQFFIITTFILILSTVFFYTAIGLLTFLLIITTIITGYISYIYEYVPTLDGQYNMLNILYDPPWTRIGPYIIGVGTAYVLLKLNHKLDIKRRTVILCWCLGSSCNILVLFGLWKRHISIMTSAIYVAMSRTVWAIGLSWLLIACCTHHGGFINKILSFKGFVPLSRLTYCAYLLNPIIINTVYHNTETALHVDFIQNITIFLGNTITTFVCAFVLSLMFETPNILLMRMLLASRERKR